MAVYKVIQDIEAEDKLLGPLTLKSFIYAAIAGLLIFIDVRLLIAGGPAVIRLPIIIIFLFPIALFGTLASPLGRDQPTEVWLLSHIRFLLKQHLRIWDQTGTDQLVTITAPKREERNLTKNFSQTEVQSRLQALATTLDSRGWVVKNSTVSLGGQPGYLDENEGGDSDRLIGPSSLDQSGQVVDVHPADDILDEQNNATAQHFNQLMQDADAQRKKEIATRIKSAREGKTSAFADMGTVGKAVTDDDIELYERIQRAEADFERKRGAKTGRQLQANGLNNHLANQPNGQPPMTASDQAVKLELAQSGNDLSVASIARLANRQSRAKQISPNEVEISLH